MTVPAALPHDEFERITRLHELGVLDTPQEKVFDLLAKVAAETCAAPIALVSLVDSDRQWFKACIGLEGITQTPRDIAFCAHAILSDDILEIPDATSDVRFARNPLVTGPPHIRFYAGAPLCMSDGSRMGTLCVIDYKPRRLSASQTSILKMLAALVVQSLEMNQRSMTAVATLTARNEQFLQMYNATPSMLHSSDAEGCIVAVNDFWLKKMGYRREEVVGRHAGEFFTADSQDMLARSIWPKFLNAGHCEDVECQMIRKDGTVLETLLSAITEFVPNGEARRTLAVIEDVTESRHAKRELQASEAHYRALVEDQSELVSLMSPEGKLTFVNAAYAQHFGIQPQDMVGTCVMEYVPEQDRAGLIAHLSEVCKNRVTVKVENQMLDAHGQPRWLAWTNRLVMNADDEVVAIHAVGRDVTEQRLAEKTLHASERFLDRTGQIAGVGGWELDLFSKELHWSDMVCRMHDLPPGHKLALDDAIAFYGVEGRALIENGIQACIAGGPGWDYELPLISATGRQFWGRAVGSAEFEDGKPVRLVGALHDITQRKAMEDKLAESRELLQVTLDSIGDAVITTDVVGKVQWLNPVAEALTGWTKEAASGQPLTQVFVIVNEETREPAADPVAKCLIDGKITMAESDTVLISRHGNEYGIKDSAAPIRDARGHFHGAVLVFHDVSEQRRLSKEVSHRAAHDVLTGLINREEFERRLQRLLDSAKKDGGSGALMFIDLDRFKVVNDACGHGAGDQLLRQVSALLQSSVRGRDTVARLGGDEFGIILERCDMARAQSIATSICEQMDEFRFTHDGRRFRIGTSIGLVSVDDSWTNMSQLLQAADSSCYAAKEAGRNRVHTWFHTDHEAKTRHGEMQWVARLEQALDENRFALYAQKIVPIGSGAKGNGLHFEVLLRMIEKDGKIVPPGAFLPAAERFHMATRIDRWVVDKTLDWLEKLGDEIDGVDLVSINLSGHAIGDRAFHQHIIDTLGRASLDVSKLCFEITETAAITSISEAKRFIDDVRQSGAKIALDDFGAGASSFGYLKTLPVDFLKIDGQFITDLLDDKLDHAAVRCFHEVATVLGVKTIAEFVERDDVLAALQAIGVDMAQGYLVHRPEPIGQMLASLRESESV